MTVMYLSLIAIVSDRDSDDSATKQLHAILDSFYCTQHVPLTETHTKGSTLDLLITKSDQLVADVRVDPRYPVRPQSYQLARANWP